MKRITDFLVVIWLQSKNSLFNKHKKKISKQSNERDHRTAFDRIIFENTKNTCIVLYNLTRGNGS